MTKEDQWEDVCERFLSRLKMYSHDKDPFVNEIYKEYVERFKKDGHLHGESDTLASDSFAWAFNDIHLPPEIYDEFYEKMFGEPIPVKSPVTEGVE